jgi:hypothetical protein
MSDVVVTDRGARMKMFIPCMNNRCSAGGFKMKLIDYADTRTFPKYQCMREGCEFSALPYDAREITRWHTDPDAPKRKHGERDAPTKEEWETAI